jgi:PKD repeat protein
VQFTSNSLNKPTDFEWFFEGGSPLISNASSVSVTYNSIGSYDVKLKVKNGVGFDSTIRTDYIKSYYFKSFANGLFDGWSQNGWNFSTSPTCQGCIYVWQNSGSGNQVYTLSKNFGAINGKLDLNFYYNIYSPGGTLRVLVNGSEVWSSSGYSAEDIQLQLPEVGNYSVTFEATIGYTQTIYLNNIKIMPR